MSKKNDERPALLAAMGDEFRQLATATILFHQAIADRLGIHITDHKCAEILLRSGSITAGDLAERTGLTTGAVTGVIDRLEKAGFVRRVKDPADRRRVVIEPFPERMEKEIGPLFGSIKEAIADLCAKHGIRELGVIRDFIASFHRAVSEATRKLREENEHPETDTGSRPKSA